MVAARLMRHVKHAIWQVQASMRRDAREAAMGGQPGMGGTAGGETATQEQIEQAPIPLDPSRSL